MPSHTEMINLMEGLGYRQMEGICQGLTKELFKQ
jgi:hypothetical protein